MIILLVMTDGRRQCIERAIPSALEQLDGPITRRVIFDDSNDIEYRDWLLDRFPNFELIWHPAGRQGFGGAIRTAWGFVAIGGPERFVWHAEDDFIYRRPVDLTAMMDVLDDHPHLVQLALRRQPWNEEERAAGGIVERYPYAYTDCSDTDDRWWLEHRLFMTTNPSLYRRSLCLESWPDGARSEGRFTHQLLEDPDVRFGFWGERGSGEWVEHIGDERVGVGY